MDEFHHLFDADRAKVMTKASQWLKVLIVNTGIPVVVCGMPEAEYVLRAEHTERRFKERLTLRCFTWRTAQGRREFCGMLKKLDETLPLAKTSGLADREIAGRLYLACRGVPDYLMTLLRGAAAEAIQRNSQSLELADLARVFEQKLAQQRVLAEQANPFIGKLDQGALGPCAGGRSRPSGRSRPQPQGVQDPKTTGQGVRLPGRAPMTSTAPVRPLPARAVPLPGESLISLIRRTSQAMAYENPRQLVALLLTQGPLPSHWNETASGPVLDHLANLLRVPPETLLPLTVHHYAPSLVLPSKRKRTPQNCDIGTVQRYFTAVGPVCPHCLQQDTAPYARLLWSFRPVPVCTEHRCLLISRCHECNRLLRSDRLDVSRCTCGALLIDAASVPVSDHGVELATKLHQLLLGQFLPVSGTSPATWFRWATHLAAAVTKTPEWLTNVTERLGIEPDTYVDEVAWLAAAEILTDWPERQEAFLDSFQQVDKHKSTSTGVGRRFGTLLRHAARLEELGHSAPADALRCYLLERYDGGHLNTKVCLFAKPGHRAGLDQRSWITQTDAAKMLGLRHGAVAALIDQGILTGKVHSAGLNGRSIGLVSRQSVETLRAELQSALNVKTVSSRLGIGRHAVLELIYREVLPRAVRTAKGWQIPQVSVTELESVYQQLPKGKRTTARWLSVRQATRKFGPTGLTLGALIEFILSGDIAARMAEPDQRLHGIVVRHAISFHLRRRFAISEIRPMATRSISLPRLFFRPTNQSDHPQQVDCDRVSQSSKSRPCPGCFP